VVLIGHLPDPGPLFFRDLRTLFFVKLRARVDAPAVPLRVRPDFGFRSSDRSQVASLATTMAASMTSAKKMRSAGRFCACGPRGISLPQPGFLPVLPQPQREGIVPLCHVNPPSDLQRWPETYAFRKGGYALILSSVPRGNSLRPD
jgi:hypothetical protein